MGYGKTLYELAPVAMQNMLCGLYGRRTLRTRYGPVFRQALASLEDSQWWPQEKLRTEQDSRLRALIAHAYEQVPYYREVMKARQLKPDDIQCVDDLPSLPVLNKAIVRDAGDELVSRDVAGRSVVHCHTSGTTGAGLRFVVSSRSFAMQWAVWWRHRGRFGFHLGDPHVNFSGQSVVPLRQSRPPFWREVRPLRQTYVSLYHMTPANMPAYVRMLEERRFPYFIGYPSAIALVADHLRQRGRPLAHPPRWIITGAESLLPVQVRDMRQWIGADVTDQYGQAEGCANLSRCEKLNYHVDMEFAAVEPIERQRSDEGRVCSLVGTSLHNYAQPFIRYDTGDLATFSDTPCDCGRAGPVASYIDGRVEDYVVTPDGRRIGRLDHCFKDMVHIAESQVIQEQEDRLRVLVVRRADYTDADERQLMHEFRARLGDAIAIDVEYVESIPRTSSGKLRAVVSRLKTSPAPVAS
ncbi:MAG: hypothetical protein WD009_07980 [Phycisphaeraceae bacterium]